MRNRWRTVRGILAVALAAASAVSLGIALLIAQGGGRWARELGVGPWVVPVSFSNAASRLGFGAVAALAAYLVWPGARWDRRRWLRFAGCLALLAVSLTVSFLAAEQWVRRQLRRTQGFNALEMLQEFRGGRDVRPRSDHALSLIVRLSKNKRLICELRPGLDKRFGGKKIRTNSAGMRSDREYAVEKSPGVVRVVGVGDSGMFGWNVEQGEDYLSVLERNLNARHDGRTYEVLNFACPGYNTQQEVELLRDRGLAYQPDIVVVGWCDNDFTRPFFLYEQREFRGWNVSYLYCYLFERAKFADLVRPRVRKARDVEKALMDPAVLEYTGEKGVRKALAELKGLGGEHRFQVLLVGPMGKRIRRICDGLGIAYLDTLSEIEAAKYPADYAVHFMHPRAGGHRVIAEHLEHCFEARGWLPALAPR